MTPYTAIIRAIAIADRCMDRLAWRFLRIRHDAPANDNDSPLAAA